MVKTLYGTRECRTVAWRAVVRGDRLSLVGLVPRNDMLV